MNRGDHRENIFSDDWDRSIFLNTLGETCQSAGWRVHAYCLMGNHFHLVLETPQPTLVTGMKWFLGTYTQRYNARHRLRGHLFSGRYKSLIVDGAESFYFRTVCDYVHLNLARAGLVRVEQALSAYPWSSLGHYLAKPARRPVWLETGRLLAELGLARDTPSARAEFERLLEQRRELGDDEDVLRRIRRGWNFGGPDFVSRLSDHVTNPISPEIYSFGQVAEIMEVKARKLIQEFLDENKWGAERLKSERKLHPLKLRLALVLRKHTTQSMAWIAREIHAGTRGTLSNELSKMRKYDNMRDLTPQRPRRPPQRLFGENLELNSGRETLGRLGSH